ncbi:MAG: hypothetical protein GX791_03040 [Synergistaceae bacterium]|nr:hypothetical protein [Synergistaceae bacterium]
MKRSLFLKTLMAAALVVLFALPVMAADLSIQFGDGVKEKLEPLGTVFTLDWGLYRNT